MLYIITEDSNSARVFWDCAADKFKGKENYELVPLPVGSDGKPTGGNTTLESQVNQAIPKLKPGDELLVVFDYIGNTKNFIPGDFIKNTIKKCSKFGASFSFTNYYCFEEIYLSYSELNRLYKNRDGKKFIADAMDFVKTCIENKKDYFDKTNDNIQKFIVDYEKDSGLNREHFANALLTAATQALNGRFKIIKSGDCFHNQGACWLMDCGEVQKKMSNEHEVQNICGNKCGYTCKGRCTEDKLLDLSENSNLHSAVYQVTGNFC